MRRIFLTSGLVLCLACPAFADIAAGTSSTSCNESVLGSTTGPVDFTSDWRPMISGTITLDSERYTSNDGPAVTPYATNASDPDTLYAVYGVGVYAEQPTVGTLSNFTTNNRMTSLTSTPTRTGYNFSGFYTTKATGGTQVIAANGSIIYPVASTQVTTEGANPSWYARWTPKQYNIVYRSADCAGVGTTISNALTYGVNPNHTILSLAAANISVPTGYEFDYFAEIPVDQYYQPGAVYGSSVPWQRNGDLVLYAYCGPKSYTVTYAVGNCGGSAMTDPSGVIYDDNYLVWSRDDTNVSVPTGYSFSGWNDGTAIRQPLYEYAPYQTDGNLTLTAVCSPNNYTVTYNAGLHGSGSAVQYTGVANGGLTYHATWTTKTFAQTGLSAASGYSFSKWNTAADGSGIDYTAGTAQSAWTTAGNLTLYAIYTANARPITYSCGSGSCGTPPSNGNATYGQSYNLSATYSSCAKEGHHATGWDCSGGATLNNATGSQAANTWSSDATISCSVHWVANTVGLNYYPDTAANGGNSTFTTGTCTYGSTFNLPTSNLPTKPGYHMNGWNIRGNGSPSACSGAQCTIPSSLGESAPTSRGYTRLNGSNGLNESTYGLTHGSGEWAATFANGDIVYGTATCANNWTGTSPSGTGDVCWCGATGYQPSGGSKCNLSETSWVYDDTLEAEAEASDCGSTCSRYCADFLVNYDWYRRKFFGLPAPAACEIPSQLSGTLPSSFGYIDGNGQGHNNTYGLTTNGSWAATFANGDVVYGVAECMPESDAQALVDGVWGAGDGNVCMCGATGYQPSGGSRCNLGYTQWSVDSNAINSASADLDAELEACEVGRCAYWCSYYGSLF